MDFETFAKKHNLCRLCAGSGYDPDSDTGSPDDILVPCPECYSPETILIPVGEYNGVDLPCTTVGLPCEFFDNHVVWLEVPNPELNCEVIA
jgi:hypothetical protein